MEVKFSDLWVGDRFYVGKRLWTKLDHRTARQHSEQSISLNESGYGYIGDTICSFELEDKVNYDPV